MNKHNRMPYEYGRSIVWSAVLCLLLMACMQILQFLSPFFQSCTSHGGQAMSGIKVHWMVNHFQLLGAATARALLPAVRIDELWQ